MRGRRGRETKRLRDEASVRRCRRERETRRQDAAEGREMRRERMDEFATGSQ